MANIHVGDIGTVITVTVKDADGVALDISGATTKNFIFKKPNNTLATVAASFVNSGTDGKLKYTSLSTTFDQAGEWQLQVYLVLPTGTWNSDIEYFKVWRNLS